MAVSPDVRQNELRRQLATLSYAHLRPSGPAEAQQAVAWWNTLARMGIRLPLFVVHDLGLLISRREPNRPQVVPLGLPVSLLSRYQALLASAAASDVVDGLAAAHLRDETIAVLLARIVGDVYWRWAGRPRGIAVEDELPMASPHYAEERADLGRGADLAWTLPLVQHLCDQQAAVLARLEQIDLGTLRLLGLFSLEARPQDLADLFQMVNTAGAADVVDFSLQLLPSLLETKRRASTQLFSVDGYASIERRGNLDSLLPGELAHDGEVFEMKTVSDDFLYYGHERQKEGGRKIHYVLVDASASMRGVRQVFARGLALALVKKFSLLGGEVWLRFFDSRLHERIEAGKGGGRELPHVLCFRSERGRNYARVFDQLATEVGRLRREDGREVAVTFITHGECQIPMATVEALARDAHLYGIFVLPSKGLRLDYLGKLHRYQVVTAESLARTSEKRRRALEIVEDAATSGPRAPSSLRSSVAPAVAEVDRRPNSSGRGG